MPHSTLTDAESRDLSSALLEMAKSGERLVRAAVIDHPVTRHSPAYKALKGPLGDSAGTNGGPVRRAQESLYFQTLAGWDHARALSTLLRGRLEVTVSVATVARGAIEAFSRAYWLLDGTTDVELVSRSLSLQIADLKFYLRSGREVRVGDGSTVRAQDREDYLTGQLEVHGLPRAETARSVLARSFLDTIVGDGDGARAYSDISSIAHGESLGVNSFAELDLTDPRAMSLVQPRNEAIEFAAWIILGGSRLSKQLLSYFDPPRAEHDRWESARDRAFKLLAPIEQSRTFA